MSRAPQSPVTQIAGALHRHAMRLLAIWLRWARHGEWIRDDVRYGLGVDVNELSLLLRRLEPLGPETLPGDEDDTPQRAWRELCDELEFLRRQDDAVAHRWLDAKSRLDLSDAELQLLALLVASSSEHALSRAFRYAWADFRRASMPLGFAVRLLSGTGELGEGRSAELAAKVLPSSSGLYSHQLLSRVREQTDTPLSELGLLAEDDTVALLLGHALSIEGYATPTQLEAPPQRSEQLMTRVLQSLPAARAENARCWLIHGPSGSGRSALAGQLARALCTGGVMQLDLGAAVESGLAEARIRRAIRCSSLLDACLVITGVERLAKEQRQRWVEVIEERLQSTRLLWIWIADEPMPELRIRPAGLVPIAYPSRGERLHVWRETLRDRAFDGALLEQLAGRFLLTEGQIARTVREAFSRAEFNSGKDNIVSLLETVARRESAIGLGRLATPETKRVELSQLVVDEATRDLLHEIISYTQHRDRLAHEWGFERAMPYGLGVTALFTGPPGTGKTMAANAIASALGLELYRVDL
ncbi:MAG: AAA family ATPase, partial [Myxococcota bacterium]|nr:AAA family ATPase [Myxococcota bacterium]